MGFAGQVLDVVRNTADEGVCHAPAKVTPPVITRALPRVRLFEKIDLLRERPVLWVSSPAGSGKTTLVSSYLKDRDIPCLWYQVDAGDDDPATLFHYLGRAAFTAVPRPRKAFPTLTPEHLLCLPTFTLRYFEELSSHLLSDLPKSRTKEHPHDKGLAIVFDNCQEVPETSAFHSVVTTGLNSVPSGITVFLISRLSPPPAYARLQANDQMGMLGWDDMMMSREETEAILCRRCPGHIARETVDHIHQITEGWAAGITLMAGTLHRKGFCEVLPGGSTPEEIMFYFGSELFDRLDDATKDFLLKTAFLPEMTAQMARELTGNSKAGHILGTLYRNNFFIQKHFKVEPSYEYHLLFREFLLNTARNSLSEDELMPIIHSAASILNKNGQVEAAMGLLRQVSGWEDMVAPIIEYAPGLIEQGRYRALQEWLSSLPEEFMERVPWLIYWKGTASLPFDPVSSKKIYELAFDLFAQKSDKDGVLLALSGIIQSIHLQFDDHSLYDPWVPVLENILNATEVFPSREVEARLVEGMVTALVLRQPDHPEIEKWIEKAYTFIDQPIPVTTKARIVFAPLFYYIYQWNVPKMNATHEMMKSLTKADDLSPLAVLILHFGEVYYHVINAHQAECMEVVERALSLGKESGIHIMDDAFHLEAAMSYLNENDLVHAQGIIDRLTDRREFFNQRSRVIYHIAQARRFLLQKDYVQALFHARKALDLAMHIGSSMYTCVCHFVLGQALHFMGKHDEEHTHLEECLIFPRQISNSTLNFYGTLGKAVCSFDLGNDLKGCELLKEAFTIGREHRHLATYVDIPAVTAGMCARAIEAGIEPEYARWLVRKRRFTLDPPPVHLEGWPWPVKIYTLGRLDILKDDEPITFSRKTQKKPLELLMAIIAAGAGDVPESRVADILWPDADGDLAMHSFATTLYRLRKLLGHPDAVVLRNGMLSLDPHLCWIDAQACENYLHKVDDSLDSLSADVHTEKICDLMCHALRFYHGEFFPEEVWNPDVLSMREHLHARILKVLTRMATTLVALRQWDKARELLERGLDIDDCAEECYQLLMACLKNQKLKAEALAVFERCRRTLEARLGTYPSPDTEALARSLRS